MEKSEVKIVSICAVNAPHEAPIGNHVFGVGDDQKVYEWDARGTKWRLYQTGSGKLNLDD